MTVPPDPRPSRAFLQVRASGEHQAAARPVANEVRLELRVDGERLLAFNCSALRVAEMVTGFLWLEGLIAGLEDVHTMRVCLEDRLVEVRLARGIDREAYEGRRTLTSGCGGGVTFQDLLAARALEPLGPGPRVTPRRLTELLLELFRGSAWYRASGGLHGAALADPEAGILVLAEDLGRHNAVDKVAGECLLRAIEPRGRVLLSTGRLSSDMVLKAARMGVPILASRTSPTDLSLGLAETLRMTVVGYIRAQRLQVYTGAERLELRARGPGSPPHAPVAPPPGPGPVTGRR